MEITDSRQTETPDPHLQYRHVHPINRIWMLTLNYAVLTEEVLCRTYSLEMCTNPTKLNVEEHRQGAATSGLRLTRSPFKVQPEWGNADGLSSSVGTNNVILRGEEDQVRVGRITLELERISLKVKPRGERIQNLCGAVRTLLAKDGDDQCTMKVILRPTSILDRLRIHTWGAGSTDGKEGEARGKARLEEP